MAFQSVPDTAQVNVVFSQNFEVMQNSFYAEHPGGYNLADLQALADAIDIVIDSIWKVRLPDECEYLRTDVRGLDTENDLVATADANSGPGDEVSSPLPNNVTLAIKKSSGLTGRSARGRTYWPALPQDKLNPANENTLTTSYVTNIVAAVDSIRGTINGVGTWEAVLVSRFSAGAKRALGVTFPWVSTENVNTVIDTQRGRMPS